MKKTVLIISTICIYLVVYIISIGIYDLPLENRYRIMNYTIIWVAKEHYFCFIWLISALFILKKRYIASIGTAAGCMIGIVIGELLGTYLKAMEILRIGYEYRYRAYHYGAFIWLIVTILSILISCYIDRTKTKSRHIS